MISPESTGISSKAILQLINILNGQGIQMHSLLIARHGQLVFEEYWAPYHHDHLHRMFSQTKSMVSLAAGLLESDGKISLSDRICRFFPEYVPENAHPWLLECTIEDLLTMRTCYDRSVYTKTDRSLCWTRQFFEGKPTHRPGTVFQYDTSGTHVLAALVEKITGQSLIDFLKDRILRRIGFSEESYCMKVGPNDGSMGGNGFMAKPVDMMRVALLLMNDGADPDHYKEPDAQQLYPADYLKRALSFQTSTMPDSMGADYGYGYCFWLMRDGYRMYGMGSELTMCFPEKDIAVVTTGETMRFRGGEERIEEMVRELIVREATDHLPEDPAALADLRKLGAKLEIPAVSNTFRFTSIQDTVDGNTFEIYTNTKGWSMISLSFTETCGLFSYTLRGLDHQIPFGIGYQLESIFPVLDEPCISSGGWIDNHTFLLQTFITAEDTSGIWFKLNFLSDGSLTALIQKTTDAELDDYNILINGQKKASNPDLL